MNQIDRYLNTHLYGCVNSLAQHLAATALEVPVYWVDNEGYEREIFSWWLVSDHMARRLHEAGYCVLDYEEEIYLWGRTTHGIAIRCDTSILKALNLTL